MLRFLRNTLQSVSHELVQQKKRYHRFPKLLAADIPVKPLPTTMTWSVRDAVTTKMNSIQTLSNLSWIVKDAIFHELSRTQLKIEVIGNTCVSVVYLALRNMDRESERETKMDIITDWNHRENIVVKFKKKRGSNRKIVKTRTPFLTR